MSHTCPSCLSKKVTKFFYSIETKEWLLSCREEIIEKENCISSPCNNIWLEFDRTPCCKCMYPLYIDIRKQIPGYWCKICDIFTPIKKKNIVINQ